MSSTSNHIAVVGAGIVGVSCALWLQQKGFKVTLLDGNQPGSITSSGNAGTIANYGCIPVNDPAIVRRLPYYLFNSDSPLTMSPAYALAHLPWMISFLRHCGKKAVTQTIHALGSILQGTNDGLDPLIKLTGTENLFRDTGCMYVYSSYQGFEDARDRNQARADQGAVFTELNGSDIMALEPGLKPVFVKGLFFENARQVVNPQALVTRFFEHFCHHQGEYIESHVARIAVQGNGISLNLDNQQVLRVAKVVISSGAFSRNIPGCGTANIPLDTERGYNIQYAGLHGCLSRPVAWAESGFYATPMDEGLRFAGTVELAGLSPEKNRKNLEFIARKAKQMIDLPGPPDSTWLGFRPTLPDSRPVIGPNPENSNILFAFGHQHIGLTLAGITGKVISEIAQGITPSINVEPFRPDRFG
jgi:D-amino-acid dehydrogenase